MLLQGDGVRVEIGTMPVHAEKKMEEYQAEKLVAKVETRVLRVPVRQFGGFGGGREKVEISREK